MDSKRIYILGAAGMLALILVLVCGALYYFFGALYFGPQDFASCAARYGVVEKSFPSLCQVPRGKLFTDPTVNLNETAFVLFSIIPNPAFSPLRFDGAVSKAWLRGGQSVTVEILGEKGNTIAESTIATPSNVPGDPIRINPFLTFSPQPKGSKGFLVISKETGTPIKIPLTF